MNKRRQNIDWATVPPSSWGTSRIKSIFCDDTLTITTQQLAEIEVDHYSIPAFDENAQPIREEGSNIASNKTLLRGGELLFSKLNSHKPRVWLVPEGDGTKVASTEFITLRPWHHGVVDKTFFRYLLSSSALADYISCYQTSVTNSHKRINPEDLWSMEVPYPGLSDQKRIAAYLDASCRAIDAAVSAKRRQIEVLDGLRKSIIQRVITRGLSTKPALKPTGKSWLEQIPDSWNLVMLKRLSEIQSGLTLGKTYDGPVIERPYLRVANVQDGYLDLDDITTIEVPPDVAKRVLLCAGDVLMTEGGDLDKLGRGYVWNGEIAGCLHQNHIFAVRCVPHLLLPKFLAYATASQYGRDYFEATGKRTTNLAATNSTKVGAFPIPLPPLSQQTEIVEFLDHQTDQFKNTQSLINQQISTLTAYRKSLIHECVTGQRRITEQDLHNLQERMTFDDK